MSVDVDQTRASALLEAEMYVRLDALLVQVNVLKQELLKVLIQFQLQLVHGKVRSSVQEINSIVSGKELAPLQMARECVETLLNKEMIQQEPNIAADVIEVMESILKNAGSKKVLVV
jgi:hypothetical protein